MNNFEARKAAERNIVRKAITVLKNSEEVVKLAVWDGENDEEYDTVGEAFDHVMNVDDACVYGLAENGKWVRRVYFALGNEPYEVLADYSTSLEQAPGWSKVEDAIASAERRFG